MKKLFTPLNLALAALCLAATLAGYLLVPPGRELAIRWGLDGSVTATAPKEFALLQMPAATAVVWVLFWAITRYGNADRDAVRARTLAYALPALTAVFAAVQIAIVWFGR